MGLSLRHMTQLCCCSLRAATASKGMNGRGCVANTLWTLKFGFHLVFKYHNITLLGFFSPTI